MGHRWMRAGVIALLGIGLFGGCVSAPAGQPFASGSSITVQEDFCLPDGVYTAAFATDSSMFRVNEANDGRGILTVADGKLSIHVSLASKNIVQLYVGKAEDAKKEDAVLLEPTLDTVTYADGWTDEVYGFDIPVPALDTEFDVALIGKKGTWYDHKVCVSEPVLMADTTKTADEEVLADGTYTMAVTLEGGTKRAGIASPARVKVADGVITAQIIWDSPNYDYMVVDGETYLPLTEIGDTNKESSVFEIPVSALDTPIAVIGDTVAMSTPHEIDYTLTFHSDTLEKESTSLVYEERMELSYAQNFSVDYYEGGYKLLTTLVDGRQFLIVPQGQEVPEKLDEGIVILQQPLTQIYLVASAVMDMFCELDSLDAVSFSGQKLENWHIEQARAAMADGALSYAGKYNKPDYELLVSEGCALAIENQMILHAPEVVEKLEDFDIPVLIEYSSSESHPLGRVEWVRFFGALLDKEEEAAQIFAEQCAILDQVTASVQTDQTVAFFFVTSNGLIQVRQSSDYVPKLIELAGGRYIFENLGDADSKRSTLNLQLEEFYQSARDADILIYNSSIDGGVADLEQLLDKCPVLADFRAVQNGQVWCTTNNLYQQSLSIGYLLEDFHAMLSGRGEDQMHYLFLLH